MRASRQASPPTRGYGRALCVASGGTPPAIDVAFVAITARLGRILVLATTARTLTGSPGTAMSRGGGAAARCRARSLSGTCATTRARSCVTGARRFVNRIEKLESLKSGVAARSNEAPLLCMVYRFASKVIDIYHEGECDSHLCHGQWKNERKEN